MRSTSYILSFGGWIGFAVTLCLIIFFDKCGRHQEQMIERKTIVNNFYDSAIKEIPKPEFIPGKPILMTIPADVDTAAIIKAYFSKVPVTRIFQDSALKASLLDTVFGNQLLPGKFSYQWIKPVRTIESTTVTVIEIPKPRIKFLIGAYAQLQGPVLSSYGPELYLQGKKGTIYGINYDIKNKAFGLKAAYYIHGNIKTR